MRRLFALLLALLAAGGLVLASQVRVGALTDDVSAWQEIAARAAGQGITVQVSGYSESTLYQKVFLYSLFGQSGLDVVEVPTKWLPQVLGRLLDLSPYASGLERQGVEIYRYGGKAIGAMLPWREDVFAAVLARSPNVGPALQLLPLISSSPAQPTTTTPTQIQSPLSALGLKLGPITVPKTKSVLPGVDGSLQLLTQAMQQVIPQGLAVPLSRAPEPAREAITKVAQLFGIPLSPDGTSVQLVVKTVGGAVPLGAGAQEEARSPSGLSLVKVPLSQLGDFLASMAGRAIVRPPYFPIPLAVSEGANLVGAAAFHAQGYTGAGVKIAIIDLGFAGLSQLQASGDLPASVITRDFTGTGIESGYHHGTAVAKIIHDIAPDAQLYLIKIGNEVDLDNAVSYCISQGVDIINHSLGWYNTNFYDGTGTIADMVRRATSAGILWVQAAGNSALKHWEGNFTDTNSDGWLDTDITLTAQSGKSILLYLTWDGWPQTSDDYDLYLYGPDGSVVASSTKTQGGSQEPTERIYTTAPATGTYHVKIQLTSGSPKRLELFSIYQDLSPHVAASSIPAPGNAAEALTVGAIDWHHYTTGPVEDFSSRGPTNDGRQKPNLVAPDNVDTGVQYYSPFPGTSAAAPHVAGVAALLLSEESLSLSALRSRILSQCVAMGDPNIYGAGRLEASPQAPPAQPDLVVQSITYTPASPVVGDTLSFEIRVKNQGTAAAGAFRVRLVGSGPAAEASIGSLAAGATRTVSLSLPLSRSPETFTATADYYHQVTESDETNNSRQITITAAPAVSAEAGGPYSGQVGQPITFDGRGSTGPIVSYRWDFGDGATASGAVVQHAYAAPGTYTARLTVRDSSGHSDTDTAQVTVSVPAQPDLVVQNITYTPANPAVGDLVTFQITVRNQGTAPAGHFYLRLDGPSGHQNAYFSGLAAGSSHTVSLSLPLSTSPATFTATCDYLHQVAESNEANNTRQITITAAAPPLTLAISLDRPSYTVGDPVRITVQLSRAAYVYLVEVDSSGKATLIFPNHWEPNSQLPAGTTVLPRSVSYTINASEPTGSEVLYGFASEMPIPLFPTSFPNPSFPILNTNGAYFLNQVRGWLASHVASGSWAEAHANFTVQPAANQPPVADFSYSPAHPSTGQWIDFDASASHDPDGHIVSYRWSFGDGTTTSGQHVTKRYSTAGTYTVRLTVRDDRGATDIATKTISVGAANQPPVAAFTYTPRHPDPGDAVQFDASGSHDPDGHIVSYRWDFGDGATGSGATVSHTYASAGSYTVKLTVRDNAGATDTETKTIQVGTPTTLPGMPVIDKPGIYVWGTDKWHITVAGSSSWHTPRKFQVVLESRGIFTHLVRTPAGSTPAPGSRIVWTGTVGAGWVDLAFDLTGDTLMKLWLYLDTDGDGNPKPRRSADAKKMVFLRACKTNPPGNPFAVYAPRGATALLPGMNFYISVVYSDGRVSPVHWTIEYREKQAGCR